MAATVGADGHPLRREVLWLLQLAMVVFVGTVGIGILNGTTPILGASIILGLVEHALQLRSGATVAPPPVFAAAATPAR
jgi:hypothetical protein